MSRKGSSVVIRVAAIVICAGIGIAALITLGNAYERSDSYPVPHFSRNESFTDDGSTDADDSANADFAFGKRHPPRTTQFVTTVTEQTSSSAYQVVSTTTLTLAASDPLVPFIRNGSIQLSDNGGLYLSVNPNDSEDDTPDVPVYDGSTVTVSFVDTQATEAQTSYIVLGWRVPAWATASDTFKLQVSAPSLVILGAQGPVPASQSAHVLDADSTKGSTDLDIAVGSASTAVANDCYSLFNCDVDQDDQSGFEGPPSPAVYDDLLVILGFSLVPVTLITAGGALTRPRRRAGIAAVVTMSGVTFAFALRIFSAQWTVPLLSANGADVVGFVNGIVFLGVVISPVLFFRPAAPDPALPTAASQKTRHASLRPAALIPFALLFVVTATQTTAMAAYNPDALSGWATAALVAVAWAACALILAVLRVQWIPAALVGLVIVWFDLLWNGPAMANAYQSPSLWAGAWSLPAVLGIIGALVTVTVLDSLNVLLRPRYLLILLALSILFEFEPWRLLHGTQELQATDIPFLLSATTGIILLIGALIAAARRGADYAVFSSPTIRTLLICAFAFCLGISAGNTWSDKGFCSAALLIGLSVAVPGRRAAQAADLAAGSIDERRTRMGERFA